MSKQIEIKVHDILYEALEERAKKEKMDINTLLNFVIAEYLGKPEEQTSAQGTEKPVEKVTIEQLYAAVVEEINSHDERFRESPIGLVVNVCRKKFGVDFASTGIDEFEIYDLLRQKAKENDYAMRVVPSREERWGLPYIFECFFYPNKSRDDRLCGGIKMAPMIAPKEFESMQKKKRGKENGDDPNKV